jgi:hypothetical protein
MIVNFRIREISRDARKLSRILTLKKKKIQWKDASYDNDYSLCSSIDVYIFSAMRWIQEMKSERIIIRQDIVNNAWRDK